MSLFCFSWWCSPAPQPGSPSRRPLLKIRWTNGGCTACAKRASGSLPCASCAAKHAAGGGAPNSATGSRPDDSSSFRLNGGRYRLHGSLGRGAHCVVWRCQLSSALVPTEERPQSLALKVHIGGTDGGRQARREADALASLEHSDGLFPRLIGMVSFLWAASPNPNPNPDPDPSPSPSPNQVSFSGRQCLALPLHGPDLYMLQKARGRKPFPFDFVVASAHQLLSALGLLGQLNLVHADVKPQNVVLPS